VTDPWLVDVESYVLGALDEPERAAFEEHLRGCPTCRAAVDEVGPLPALLDLVPPDLVAEIVAGDPVAASVPGPPDDQVPDSVLAGLLWSVRRQEHSRRRRRVVVGAFAAAAAVLLAVLPWSPLSPFARPGSDVRVVAMAATAPSPITASAALEGVAWGTKIDLSCTYAGGAPGYGQRSTYSLVVVADDGSTEQVATWTAVPGATITVPAATGLPITQIASIELVAPDGSTLLRGDL
jgi:anti-sigma factor RsiW